ncbi:MAG: phospholipid carrier-dependent glycosyltransferase [Pseudomonadota bacterium]
MKRNSYGNLSLIIAVAAAVAFSIWQRSMLDFRAGHMDEYDYLFVGKSLLQGLEWPTYTYIFGADFNWYLFGTAEQWFGGLSGARVASAILGVVSLVGVYLLGTALWNSRQVALCAALLLGVHSSHIFASKVATYDSVSLALFALALAPLVHGAGQSHHQHSKARQTILMAVGSLLMLFAVLSKYTTIAYLPFIGLALMMVSFRAFLIFAAITGVGLTAHLALHWEDLRVLYDVQISGIHGSNATYKEIISRGLNNTWLLLLPAVIALIHAKSSDEETSRRPFYIVGGLLIFSLPLFLYHLQGRNLISLYKHLNYANLFLSLAAAWLFILVAQAKPWRTSRIFRYRMPILATLMAVYLFANYQQLKATEQGYPDVTQLLEHIDSNSVAGTVLSEDPYLFRYLMFEQTDQQNIRETTWLDNDQDGQYTAQDVKDAIWDRKFDFVLLTDAIHPQHNETLRDILAQRGYDLVFNNEYSLSAVMTTHTQGQISLYQRQQTFAATDEVIQ